MRHPVRAAGWLTLYVLLAIAPLPLSLIDLDPGRGFWVNLSVALGFVALSLMGLQFVLAARFVRATTTFGIDPARALALLEQGQKQPRRLGQPEEVDLHDRPQPLRGAVGERAAGADAGVIDEDVQATEVPDRGIE